MMSCWGLGSVIPAKAGIHSVIPAKAGIHLHNTWIPAFAGMTMDPGPRIIAQGFSPGKRESMTIDCKGACPLFSHG